MKLQAASIHSTQTPEMYAQYVERISGSLSWKILEPRHMAELKHMHRLSQQRIVPAVKRVMIARPYHNSQWKRTLNNTVLVMAWRKVYVFENCAVCTGVISGFKKDISEVFW